jgi:hypothetical protein
VGWRGVEWQGGVGWIAVGKRPRGRPGNRCWDEVLKGVKGIGCEKLDKGGDGQMDLASGG